MRLAAALVAALALVAAGCGGDDEAEPDAVESVPAATQSASGCEASERPLPKPDGGQQAPTKPLGPGTYELVVETNCGAFTIELDTKSAPKTAASLVALAEDGYFDNLTFHRIVPGFVIQGGDPTGTGTGGPGYSTVDVPPPGSAYTKGIVAMAKSGAEEPGTSGSQFFVVTADDAGLPPDYAIVGSVTEGLDVVERIGTLGDPTTEAPLEPIVIRSVTVRKS
jgi:cyclophilin family peptidyl-prolyl cis-trans isomerase